MNEKTPVFRPALSNGYGDNVHPGLAEWYRRHRATERVAPIDDDGTVDR
jgi:hypothetical protein